MFEVVRSGWYNDEPDTLEFDDDNFLPPVLVESDESNHPGYRTADGVYHCTNDWNEAAQIMAHIANDEYIAANPEPDDYTEIDTIGI